MKIHPVVHISLLDKTENQGTKDVHATEIEYNVEKIIDKRVRNGITGYRVRWAGYDESEDTWELTRNLSCREFKRSSSSGKVNSEEEAKG